MTRVPYHQNVYDLLGLDPGVDAAAKRKVQAHEKKHRPLPASVREWFLLPDSGNIWYAYSNMDPPASLDELLAGIADPILRGEKRRRYAVVMGECQNVGDWRIELDGTDDPPAFSVDPHHRQPGNEYRRAADTFSEFVWNWIAEFHSESWTGEPDSDYPKMHFGGHWAAAPAAEYPLPLLDYLSEQYGEPETAAFPGVRRHTFRDGDGVLRLTTDEPGHPTPHAAWWVYSPDADQYKRLLSELGRWKLPVRRFRTSARSYADKRFGRL